MTSSTSPISIDSNPPLTVELLVEEGDVGQRLDAWLTGQLEGTSRSQVGRAVTSGRVTLNGAVPTKAGVKLQAGDRVAFTPEPVVALDLEPQELTLPLVHVDRWLAVVDKPAGMVVHPSAGHPDGTLVNALLYHLGPLSGGDPERPGVVHRLDRDTTGLLVVARDTETHRALSDQFRARTVHRRYLTVVHGIRLDDSGTLETPYGRHPKHRLKFSGQVREGKRACTHFRVLARGEALSLLEVALETGRTHQIRVHLAERGYPIVGDPLYGRKVKGGGGGRLATEMAAARRIERQALHAAELGFAHPATGEELRFESALPPDMAELVRAVFDLER